MEFRIRNIPYERERKLPILYRGEPLNAHYRIDFMCFGAVIVELKALGALSTIEEAQILHFLKASDLHRGLLINFGTPQLQYKRFVLNLR